MKQLAAGELFRRSEGSVLFWHAALFAVCRQAVTAHQPASWRLAHARMLQMLLENQPNPAGAVIDERFAV